MSSSAMTVIDIFIFCYIILGLVNPSYWIHKPELKNDPNEQKKMRKIAGVLLIVEIVFCVFTYLL